jgi:hypothetical protein
VCPVASSQLLQLPEDDFETEIYRLGWASSCFWLDPTRLEEWRCDGDNIVPHTSNGKAYSLSTGLLQHAYKVLYTDEVRDSYVGEFKDDIRACDPVRLHGAALAVIRTDRQGMQVGQGKPPTGGEFEYPNPVEVRSRPAGRRRWVLRPWLSRRCSTSSRPPGSTTRAT